MMRRSATGYWGKARGQVRVLDSVASRRQRAARRLTSDEAPRPSVAGGIEAAGLSGARRRQRRDNLRGGNAANARNGARRTRPHHVQQGLRRCAVRRRRSSEGAELHRHFSSRHGAVSPNGHRGRSETTSEVRRSCIGLPKQEQWLAAVVRAPNHHCAHARGSQIRHEGHCNRHLDSGPFAAARRRFQRALPLRRLELQKRLQHGEVPRDFGIGGRSKSTSHPGRLFEQLAKIRSVLGRDP